MIAEIITDLRRAARAAIRRPDLTDTQRCRVIIELACRARESEWPWAGQTAIWGEVRDYLANLTGETWMGTPASYPEVPVPPVEAAARRLRARGFETCPECRLPVPDDRTLERWRSLRAAALDEARRKEAAVDAA